MGINFQFLTFTNNINSIIRNTASNMDPFGEFKNPTYTNSMVRTIGNE